MVIFPFQDLSTSVSCLECTFPDATKACIPHFIQISKTSQSSCQKQQLLSLPSLPLAYLFILPTHPAIFFFLSLTP
jgi:hypothetical protein